MIGIIPLLIVPLAHMDGPDIAMIIASSPLALHGTPNFQRKLSTMTELALVRSTRLQLLRWLINALPTLQWTMIGTWTTLE